MKGSNLYVISLWLKWSLLFIWSYFFNSTAGNNILISVGDINQLQLGKNEVFVKNLELKCSVTEISKLKISDHSSGSDIVP